MSELVCPLACWLSPNTVDVTRAYPRRISSLGPVLPCGFRRPPYTASNRKYESCNENWVWVGPKARFFSVYGPSQHWSIETVTEFRINIWWNAPLHTGRFCGEKKVCHRSTVGLTIMVCHWTVKSWVVRTKPEIQRNQQLSCLPDWTVQFIQFAGHWVECPRCL